MKQLKNLCYLGLALVAFSACSSDTDELVVNNDLQNQVVENGVVKTQFAISVPAGSTGKDTRMSAADVQEDHSFGGISDLYLLSGTGLFAGDKTATAVIPLAAMGNTDIVYGATESKIYSDVDVKVGTTHFLVYAKSAATTIGKLNMTPATLEGTPSAAAITFALENREITPGSGVVGRADAEKAMLDLLKKVDATEGWLTGHNDEDVSAANSLKGLHDEFRKLNTLSSAAVKTTLNDLYKAVDVYKDAAGVSTVVAAIKANIVLEIAGVQLFEVEGTDIDWKVTNAGYTNLPGAYNLPEGAVAIKHDGTVFAKAALGDQVNVNNITYPASLWYTANTGIWTNTMDTFTWPSLLADWSNANGRKFNGWLTSVTATTNKIALSDNLNYGVACLETQVKVAADAEIKDKDNNDINLSNIKLTGVLVGDQPAQLGWDFLPTTGDVTTFTKTVYDNAPIDVTLNRTDYQTACYTLLCDNKQNTVAKTVNVALEFQYNGTSDFVGAQGKIKSGTKFYLVGKLNLDDVKTVAGEATADHIFVKDHKTVAKFIINGLGNAYNTIPDLRSTMLQLGLSVDLVWEAGYTFEVELN